MLALLIAIMKHYGNETFIIKSLLLYMMPLVPVDLLEKVIQNTTNDCKAFRLSLLKPQVQFHRPDALTQSSPVCSLGSTF